MGKMDKMMEGMMKRKMINMHKMESEEVMKNMHEIMPMMMVHCTSSFNYEDRRNILNF